MSLHCVASAGQKNHFRPPSKRSTGMLAVLRAGLPVKKLEVNMHHLKGNTIPAGHVQNALSESYEIFFR